MSTYFLLSAPVDAPPEVLKYQGQIMSRFSFLDTDNLIGLASLAGRPDEGSGIRIPEDWAIPATPEQAAHGAWLTHTFFERESYVTAQEALKQEG